MSERHPVPAVSDRRPAIWPWFAMPAAALALFWTLHTVRHTGHTAQLPAQAPAASAVPAQ
jgi:hypothetical protein